MEAPRAAGAAGTRALRRTWLPSGEASILVLPVGILLVMFVLAVLMGSPSI